MERWQKHQPGSTLKVDRYNIISEADLRDAMQLTESYRRNRVEQQRVGASPQRSNKKHGQNTDN